MMHVILTNPDYYHGPRRACLLLWLVFVGSILVACGREPLPVGANIGRGGMILQIELPATGEGDIERISVYRESRGLDALRGPRQVKQPNGERSRFYHIWLRPEEWQPIDAYLNTWCITPPRDAMTTAQPGDYLLAFQCPTPQRYRQFALAANELPPAFQVIIRATYDVRRFTQ